MSILDEQLTWQKRDRSAIFVIASFSHSFSRSRITSRHSTELIRFWFSVPCVCVCIFSSSKHSGILQSVDFRSNDRSTRIVCFRYNSETFLALSLYHHWQSSTHTVHSTHYYFWHFYQIIYLVNISKDSIKLAASLNPDGWALTIPYHVSFSCILISIDCLFFA